MSPPWSNLLDIERLADSNADIAFSVPLEELALLAHFAGLAGTVSGHARLARVAGIPVAELTLQGSVRLTCQRCLGVLEVPVDRRVRIGLVETEAALERVPDDLEPMLAPEGRISMGALVEEEMLLTLPIVPQHEDLDHCIPAEPVVAAAKAEAPPETHRPFAGLGDLLNRK